jgi:2-polyprenyl-6-methoxyphenol hydroxylase-like FAD-dependent oxidoreductase
MAIVSRDPVIVVGAGIGGLTCALALLRRGIEVEVYEQAPQLGEIGAGVQLSANGTRVLHALGLERGLADWAVRPHAKEIRHWKSGRTWKLFDLGVVSEERYGAPYIFIHRGDLHRLLVEAVRAVAPQAISLQARCVGVEQDAGGVTLLLADGRRVRGRLLIGADGVHSAVRESVFGAGRPEFTGCMAWRGVIAVERLPGGRMPLAGTNWIGPGRHVVHYPLRRGELLNFVGVVERGDWQIESWTAQGTQGECCADFAGWHPDVQALIEAIETPFKWALMARSAMTRWSEGRVTLIGDACHAALPFLAQGAAMAIEDAFVLAAALAAHGEDQATALARYEAARIPRTTRVVEGSAANTRRFHNPRLADDAGAGDYIASEWSEEKIEQRYDWLFTYNALNVDIR